MELATKDLLGQHIQKSKVILLVFFLFYGIPSANNPDVEIYYFY